MPWNVSDVMSEKMQMILKYRSGDFEVAELSRRYGVSRQTLYKWLGRFERHGAAGLEEHSRCPRSHPNRVSKEIEQAIVDTRGERPLWGAPKLRKYLMRTRPSVAWPAQSTFGEILKRHGLTITPRRRRRACPRAEPLAHCQEPNAVWSADFKGWFRTGDGVRCDPLTITDGHSRFILRCQAMVGQTGFNVVKPLFEATFREHGMPLAIRTDNGPPFATTGLAGLSMLSVWWIRLGIRPERIAPGKPQENGRHERMHRTLKAATANPPHRDQRAQQRAFDQFVAEFNFERPHEALGQELPAEHYGDSPRPYPERLADQPPYPDDWETRKVRKGGQMKWNGHDVRLSNALWGLRVGLEPLDDGVWQVHLGNIPLGIFRERTLKIERPRPQHRDNAKRKG